MPEPIQPFRFASSRLLYRAVSPSTMAVQLFVRHADCVVAVALREWRDDVMSLGKHCVSASTLVGGVIVSLRSRFGDPAVASRRSR
jgi:hypothetical protein